MRRPILFAALAAAILSTAPVAVAGETPDPGPLLVVLEHPADSQTKAADQVTVLDPTDLRVVGRAPVDVRRFLAIDRDGRHLIAWGTGDISLWTGKAKDPATLEISDLADHRIDHRFTLFKPPFVGVLDGEHGRYYAIDGSDGDTPATLLAIDLVGRREIGRTSLGRAAERVDWERADDLLYVLVGTDDAGRKALPARLLVYDAVQARVIQETALAPRPLGLFRLGGYVYAVCRGSGKQEKGAQPGKVYVFDAATHAPLAEHQVGFEPTLVRRDPVDRSLFVVARGEDETRPGSLTELRAHLVRIQAVVPGDFSDLQVDGDGDTLYLLAPDSVLELARRDLNVVHQYRLPFDPTYVLSDTSHRRAFVGAERGSDIAILDREAGTLVAAMKTGRSGVKVGKGLLSALSMAASPVIYWPGATATGAVPSADGKRLFVVNVQTNDVTVIDLGEAKALEMLRVGTQPYFMSTSTATPLIWVFSSEHVTRIDTGTLQQVDVDLTSKEGLTGWPYFDGDSRRILVPRESGLEILSMTDGSPAGTVGGLSHPVRISLEPRLAVALPDPAPAETLPPAE